MNRIANLSFLLLTVSVLFGCSTSRIYRPREINCIGDYYHTKTMIAFPQSVEGFVRKNITSFNKDNTNIGISYYADSLKQDVHATIYIYPAPVAMEDRIRDEYLNSLQSISNYANQKIDAVQKQIIIEKDGYRVFGLRATISRNNLKTVLALFECGKYFIKYRVTSTGSDTMMLNKISSNLIDQFSPIDIVKKQPIVDEATIHIAPGIVNDTLSLDPILFAALAKVKWVNENVDSLERCSGFPSLYFEEQQITILEMLKKWESLKSNNALLEKYFNDLLIIRDSGFLNEFIFEQYGGILLLPEGLKLDFDNYNVWKMKNNPSVSLVGPIYYYLIGYEESYENEN